MEHTGPEFTLGDAAGGSDVEAAREPTDGAPVADLVARPAGNGRPPLGLDPRERRLHSASVPYWRGAGERARYIAAKPPITVRKKVSRNGRPSTNGRIVTCTAAIPTQK